MRIPAVIAALYYFMVTMGVSISFHFCEGELTCFSFLSHNNLCCHANADEHGGHNHAENTICADDCCSTESINITLESDFTIEADDIPNNEFSPVCGEGFCDTLFIDSQTNITDAPARGSPSGEPLYLMYSSFVFYG